MNEEVSKKQLLQSSARSQTIAVLDNRFYLRNIRLGSGSFATVYAGWDDKNNSFCAIKQISKKKILQKIGNSKDKIQTREYHLGLIRREARILNRIQHKNVIGFYGLSENSQAIYFCMEYCSQGSLHDLIKIDHGLSYQTAFPLMMKIVKACHHLHRNGIFHRDIKPQNIFMHQGEPKIGDFGLALDIHEAEQDYKCNFWVGTPGYMAPEVQQRECVTLKSDVWSLGVTFYEMLCGKLPWDRARPQQWQQSVNNLKFTTNEPIPESVKQTILRMLEVDYKKRPSMSLVNDFFNY